MELIKEMPLWTKPFQQKLRNDGDLYKVINNLGMEIDKFLAFDDKHAINKLNFFIDKSIKRLQGNTNFELKKGDILIKTYKL